MHRTYDLSDTDLGIGVRPPKGSFNFSCFVNRGSRNNIEEHAIHIVLKTVSI
jgi:hypothetical protein